jgi:cell division protein FtsI/penicillin-binding protein 2
MLGVSFDAAGASRPRAKKSAAKRTGGSRSTGVKKAAASKKKAPAKASRPRLTKVVATGPYIAGGPWTAPTYADSTLGDHIDGEDLNVRRAAVEALGPYNGSVVVVDPKTGRILTMVNQRVALGTGFQPCSTIKLSVGLAGLSEGVIKPENSLRVSGMGRMDLTYALAHSNNSYFAHVGQALGFEKVSYYARLFGYGERAGLNIPGESAGRFPSAPPSNGGVGMLSSFGEEISQTPLQLAALVSAIANNGTLYYLQYPRNMEEGRHFVPRVKRHLDIAKFLPLLTPGMRGAVEYGTAHRARENGEIAGKTGTCTESRTHLGWFGSFNATGRDLVVVVLLTGGRPSIGALAADIAGQIYARVGTPDRAEPSRSLTPATILSTPLCCSR